jgi:metallo-beta-lactamase family protein
MMNLEFFGAAGEVTGSCHILRAGGKTVLLDCGLIQGSRADEERNAQPFPFDAARIDAVWYRSCWLMPRGSKNAMPPT